MDEEFGGGGHHFVPPFPFQFQPPFQDQFGMLPPGRGMPGSSRGRGIPSFFQNWGGYGPLGGLGTTPPIRPNSAPPANQSEMVNVLNS